MESDEADITRELEHLRKIEAVLFISGRYLELKEIVSLTDINPLLVRKLVEDLQDKYKDSGMQIVSKGDSWKMDVAPDYVPFVNKLATGNSEFSKAEQESLAVLAFKQPMKQSILIKIRGNKAYDHVKRFAELGLIVKKRTGRTWELSLSDSFHDYFHSASSEQGVEKTI